MYVRLGRHKEPLWQRLPIFITDRFQDTWLERCVAWIDARTCRRREEVRIDSHDLWDLDANLALVIYPALKQLREVRQGIPHLDLADIPFELRHYQNNEPSPEHWDYILDEMIYAFEHYALNINGPGPRTRNGLRLFGKYYSTLWD
jgi:hypothetical protein